MADTKINTGSTEPIVEHTVEAKEVTVDGEAKVPTPYTEYTAETGQPFVADHYKLGENWEVFAGEIAVIDEYMDGLISSGKIANTTKAVDEVLEQMEKVTNIKDEDRSVVRIETVKAHIDFLNKTDKIYSDFGKYGNN